MISAPPEYCKHGPTRRPKDKKMFVTRMVMTALMMSKDDDRDEDDDDHHVVITVL